MNCINLCKVPLEKIPPTFFGDNHDLYCRLCGFFVGVAREITDEGEYTLREFFCWECGNEWPRDSRKTDKPARCPECKSTKWSKPQGRSKILGEGYERVPNKGQEWRRD